MSTLQAKLPDAWRSTAEKWGQVPFSNKDIMYNFTKNFKERACAWPSQAHKPSTYINCRIIFEINTGDYETTNQSNLSIRKGYAESSKIL